MHVWAYISLLDILPVTLLQMSLWNISGVAAYVLVFALIESVLVFAIFLLVRLILPETLFNLQSIQLLIVFIFTTSLAAIFINLYEKWDIRWLSFSNWIALWSLVSTGSFILAVNRLSRNPRSREILAAAVERLAVLSSVYVSLDILGVLVILIRNLVAPFQ